MNIAKNKELIGSVIVIVLVIAFGWYALSAKQATGQANANEVVAVVNGQNVLRGELTHIEANIAAQQGLSATSSAALAQVQPQALDSLIAETLLVQAATAAGLTASSTAVDAQLATIKGQFATPDAYQKELAAEGLTEDQLRTQTATSMTIQAYLDKTLNFSSTTVTEAEIQSAYTQSVAGQPASTTPPLSAVHAQVEQMLVQQKQSQLVAAEVARLRAAGSVQILIATSTPAA